MFQLTKGSLKKILDGQQVVDPLLQILQIKNIQNNMDGVTRYKVTLWDSETQHTFGILATQKNHLIENNELKIGSVIKLEEYASNVLSKDPPKVVVILLNFEIVGEMDPKAQQSNTNTASVNIKDEQQAPKHVQNENIEPNKNQSNFDSKGSNQQKNFYSNTNAPAKPAIAKLNSSTANSTMNSSASQNGTFNGFKIFGISSLNPYQNKWAIKARVTNKSAIRTYSNSKGEGKLFSVEFIDQTGEIRATGFNDSVDRFYEMLQINNVYYISRCSLKTANRQYSKVDNDYEMTFGNETVIEPCEDGDEEMPHLNLNIVPLGEILNKNANDYVDIIGIVRSINEVATITAKATNKEIKKRDINLVDDSNYSINCTLWGTQAETFDGSDNPVILLKGAKVGDYGGRTLSVTNTTILQLNPDIPQAHQLKGWFDQGLASNVQDLSNGAGASGSGSQTGPANYPAQWKTLDTLKEDKMGLSDKGDYLTSKATILFAKKDNSMYMACPGENCNKKVIDQNDGTFRCEKCSRAYPNFKWRMILNVNIADHTDSNWATLFQESAELVLGIKADDLGELKNNNVAQYDEVFSKCVFSEFNMKLRAKIETYNDEKRLKVSVASCEPIDYVASSKRLLQNIRTFAKNNL